MIPLICLLVSTFALAEDSTGPAAPEPAPSPETGNAPATAPSGDESALSAPGSARATSDDAVAATTSASTTGPARDIPGKADVPIYLSARTASAVPSAGHGAAFVGGLGIGILPNELNGLGLRAIVIDNPPKNPLGKGTAAVPWAWGPVIDWQHWFQPESRASFYTSVSLGYVYGTPEDDTETNVILPVLEGGVGLRFLRETRSGHRLYLAPEIGFVPGALAPYACANLGVILPGADGK